MMAYEVPGQRITLASDVEIKAPNVFKAVVATADGKCKVLDNADDAKKIVGVIQREAGIGEGVSIMINGVTRAAADSTTAPVAGEPVTVTATGTFAKVTLDEPIVGIALTAPHNGVFSMLIKL